MHTCMHACVDVFHALDGCIGFSFSVGGGNGLGGIFAAFIYIFWPKRKGEGEGKRKENPKRTKKKQLLLPGIVRAARSGQAAAATMDGWKSA